MDEWSESSIEGDLGMRFPISSLYLAFNDFAFFKHSFYRKRRLLKRVPYLFIFVIRENEILIAVIRDSLFFLFVNRARDPPYTTLIDGKVCICFLAVAFGPSDSVSVDCKTVRIFAYSSTREQSNKRSGMGLKTESETGERR